MLLKLFLQFLVPFSLLVYLFTFSLSLFGLCFLYFLLECFWLVFKGCYFHLNSVYFLFEGNLLLSYFFFTLPQAASLQVVDFIHQTVFFPLDELFLFSYLFLFQLILFVLFSIFSDAHFHFFHSIFLDFLFLFQDNDFPFDGFYTFFCFGWKPSFFPSTAVHQSTNLENYEAVLFFGDNFPPGGILHCIRHS